MMRSGIEQVINDLAEQLTATQQQLTAANNRIAELEGKLRVYEMPESRMAT
jgi:uncharacterized protein involved in exopolysaccharide biosynthesis